LPIPVSNVSAVKSHLIFKLLFVNLVVIAFVMAVVWFSIDTLAAGYFVTLMHKYHISPKPAHAMFVDSVHRYLIWTCLGAVGLAILLSFLMLRRILSPLMLMTQSTREIAAGDYSSRVSTTGKDEVGQLASAFNRMAASLEKIEKLRRNLMIDVAHELRTPLTNIRGYLEALNDQVLPPSPETLKLLQDETMRLVQLVEDVLSQARADAAHGHLEIEPVDLNAAVHSALAPYSDAFHAKNMEIRVLASPNAVSVPADMRRLERVLRNLTDNAVRYAPAGSELTVEITADNRLATVAYINKVQNMAPDDLPYLFERFFRGEKSRSREHGGAGIGLSIVQEVVTAHGGSIGAELVEEDLIRIWFSLPK
jgi:two-component system, OmpR family, sensor histidine kinase BaeS